MDQGQHMLSICNTYNTIEIGAKLGGKGGVSTARHRVSICFT
jgi:hypothetical protein